MSSNMLRVAYSVQKIENYSLIMTTSLLTSHYISTFPQDVFSTAMEFSKLEKVEIAGIKGKVLSHQVVEIFNEFNELYAMFGNRTYDGLDATNKVQ